MTIAHLRPRSTSIFALALTLLLARALSAQTHYHNLDAGQPGRIEDAQTTSLYTLGFDISPLQFERLAGGTTRFRAEPKLSYGILPLTEVEVRVPFVQVIPPTIPGTSGSAGVAGAAGLSIGIMHTINIETMSVPSLAFASEVSLPIGGLAPSRGSFMVKGLLTKTLGSVRMHVNGGGGTYALRVQSANANDAGCGSNGVRLVVAGDTTCGSGPVIVFDAPCNVVPSGSPVAVSASRYCMGAQRPDSATVQPLAPTHGGRWFAGVGLDRAFALHSTLVTADLYAERFVGLYSSVDWTAEAGVRHQLTPIIVVNGGVGRHFAGAITSTFVMAGASFEFATPPFFGR